MEEEAEADKDAEPLIQEEVRASTYELPLDEEVESEEKQDGKDSLKNDSYIMD